MNSLGLSVVMRSEAHGSKTIPVPTLKGLNHVSVGYRLGSTPSGSDLPPTVTPGGACLRVTRGYRYWYPPGTKSSS